MAVAGGSLLTTMVVRVPELFFGVVPMNSLVDGDNPFAHRPGVFWGRVGTKLRSFLSTLNTAVFGVAPMYTLVDGDNPFDSRVGAKLGPFFWAPSTARGSQCCAATLGTPLGEFLWFGVRHAKTLGGIPRTAKGVEVVVRFFSCSPSHLREF